MIKEYRLLTGELAGTISGEANPIFKEQDVTICYAEDVDEYIKELEDKLQKLKKPKKIDNTKTENKN